MSNYYVVAEKCTVDDDTANNVYVTAGGVFEYDALDDGDKIAQQLESFIAAARIVVERDCTVVERDDDSHHQVGDVIRTAVVDVDYDDDWINVTTDSGTGAVLRNAALWLDALRAE